MKTKRVASHGPSYLLTALLCSLTGTVHAAGVLLPSLQTWDARVWLNNGSAVASWSQSGGEGFGSPGYGSLAFQTGLLPGVLPGAFNPSFTAIQTDLQANSLSYAAQVFASPMRYPGVLDEVATATARYTASFALTGDQAFRLSFSGEGQSWFGGLDFGFSAFRLARDGVMVWDDSFLLSPAPELIRDFSVTLNLPAGGYELEMVNTVSGLFDMKGEGWQQFHMAAIPEPATYALFALGLVGLGLAGSARNSKVTTRAGA